MTDTPQSPPSPAEVARTFADAWNTWLRASTAASTAAMTGSAATADPFAQLNSAFSGYAGAVSEPLRELADQQRELAESMEEWARLQRALAEHVQTWAQQQRKLADSLDLMVAPLSAFTRPPD
jgi:methyl-accepting chemotaxis protein